MQKLFPSLAFKALISEGNLFDVSLMCFGLLSEKGEFGSGTGKFPELIK